MFHEDKIGDVVFNNKSDVFLVVGNIWSMDLHISLFIPDTWKNDAIWQIYFSHGHRQLDTECEKIMHVWWWIVGFVFESCKHLHDYLALLKSFMWHVERFPFSMSITHSGMCEVFFSYFFHILTFTIYMFIYVLCIHIIHTHIHLHIHNILTFTYIYTCIYIWYTHIHIYIYVTSVAFICSTVFGRTNLLLPSWNRS